MTGRPFTTSRNRIASSPAWKPQQKLQHASVAAEKGRLWRSRLFVDGVWSEQDRRDGRGRERRAKINREGCKADNGARDRGLVTFWLALCVNSEGLSALWSNPFRTVFFFFFVFWGRTTTTSTSPQHLRPICAEPRTKAIAQLSQPSAWAWTRTSGLFPQGSKAKQSRWKHRKANICLRHIHHLYQPVRSWLASAFRK